MNDNKIFITSFNPIKMTGVICDVPLTSSELFQFLDGTTVTVAGNENPSRFSYVKFTRDMNPEDLEKLFNSGSRDASKFLKWDNLKQTTSSGVEMWSVKGLKTVK